MPSRSTGSGKRLGEGPAGVTAFPDQASERHEDERAIVREEIASLPELRMEKVIDAKDRIRDRFYDRPDVVEAVLRRLAGRLRDRRDRR